MAMQFIRRVRDLAGSLILSPERYDPRRMVDIKSDLQLVDVAQIITENFSAKKQSRNRSVLVLDTTHATEGFIICSNEPVDISEMGSAKRRLQPGDVIISRLRPYLRQVAYIDESLFSIAGGENEVAASTEFYVLRSKGDFNVAALVPFLLSAPAQNALSAGQEGGHHPRFSKELLESLKVPEALALRSNAIGSEVVSAAAELRKAWVNGRLLVSEVEAL